MTRMPFGMARVILLVAAMATGFAEFPAHARFIGAVLIFAHASASYVVSVIHTQGRRTAWESLLSELTLQIGLREMAQSSEGGQPIDDEAKSQIWRAAAVQATQAIDQHDAEQGATPPPVAMRWVISLTGLAFTLAFYAVLVGVAVAVSRLLI